MGELIKIAKYDSRFSDLRFVLRAIDKNDIKPFFKCLKVEKDKIVATDSRRLHFVNKEMKIPEGLYIILFNNKKEIVIHEADKKLKYPNWKMVIPKDYLKRQCTNFSFYSGIAEPIKLNRQMPEDIGLQFNYLSDLKGYPWSVYIPSKDKPFEAVIFKSGNVFAAIMPVRLNNIT